MNRREAIAALTALPGLTRISSADLTPTDVLVIESDHHVSLAEVERISTVMQQIWPGRKVVVLDKGQTLKVVSQSGGR